MKIDKGALEYLRTVLTEAASNGDLNDDVLHDAIVYGINNAYDGTNVDHIQGADELERFRLDRGIRSDWHEPDEQAITAIVIGHNLDTASTHVDDIYDHDKSWESLTVVLHEEATNENSVVTGPGKPLAYVNLAQLLAWACKSAYPMEDE